MKLIHLVLLVLCSTNLYTQTIPDYYNDVNLSVSGIALKNELTSKITMTHTNELSYSDIWNASKFTDLNPTNNQEVLLVYGYEDGSDNNPNNNRERDLNETCGSGSCVGLWNREHVYSNSLATPDLNTNGNTGAPYADGHNLRPCDSSTNSSRGNRKFSDDSGDASGATDESYTSYNGDIKYGWYPGDEWKGDIARIVMYMYLRYDSQCLPTNVGLGNASETPDDMIDLFLQWNVDDPVSDFEIQRNAYHNSSAEYAQGNRNPFIDNPFFATKIWGGPQAEDKFSNFTDIESPTIPTAVTSTNITGNSFTISWTASTDNASVTGYNILINEILIDTSNTTSYNATGLNTSSKYEVTIQAYDPSGNISLPSAPLIIHTGADTTTATDLFISEYIEGSSYNKALELVNYTGNTIDLNLYSLKIQANGAGSWSNAFSLSGTLANGDVIVISHASASQSITDHADFTPSSSVVNFNGNDPIGLFKNNALIDIIGVFDGGTVNFAKDVTLQRKSSITSPNTSYTSTEWILLDIDTFTKIGHHLVSGTNTFIGITDNDWNTPSNWSFNYIPNNSDAIIKAGKTAIITEGVFVRNLTLEYNSTLTIGENISSSNSEKENSKSSLKIQRESLVNKRGLQ